MEQLEATIAVAPMWSGPQNYYFHICRGMMKGYCDRSCYQRSRDNGVFIVPVLPNAPQHIFFTNCITINGANLDIHSINKHRREVPIYQYTIYTIYTCGSVNSSTFHFFGRGFRVVLSHLGFCVAHSLCVQRTGCSKISSALYLQQSYNWKAGLEFRIHIEQSALAILPSLFLCVSME